MILAINDSRNLALALLDPPSGQWYNWTTRLMDAAFNYVAHVKTATLSPITIAVPTGTPTPPAPPPTLFANTKFVDCGAALENQPNLVPVWLVLDANGVPQIPSDLWGNPAPERIPTWGGFAR